MNSNAFAPEGSIPLAQSIDCEEGIFDYNLFWYPGGSTPTPCGPGADTWFRWTSTTPPFASFDPDKLWTENDYHLIPALRDTGAPAVDLRDPDGTRNDPGYYGGPKAGRGIGALTAACAPSPRTLTAVLEDSAGAHYDALTPRDLPAPADQGLGSRQDLYLLYAPLFSHVALSVEADGFNPRIEVFSPAFVAPAALSPSPGYSCDSEDATAAHTGTGAFDLVVQESGYLLLRVSAEAETDADLGPYTLTWAF